MHLVGSGCMLPQKNSVNLRWILVYFGGILCYSSNNTSCIMIQVHSLKGGISPCPPCLYESLASLCIVKELTAVAHFSSLQNRSGNLDTNIPCIRHCPVIHQKWLLGFLKSINIHLMLLYHVTPCWVVR